MGFRVSGLGLRFQISDLSARVWGSGFLEPYFFDDDDGESDGDDEAPRLAA